jgi:hypothetical protein
MVRPTGAINQSENKRLGRIETKKNVQRNQCFVSDRVSLPTAQLSFKFEWAFVEPRLRLIEEARLTLGREAAASLWRQIGLPMPVNTPPARQDALPPDIADFINAEIEFDAGERLRATALYRGYVAWAERTGRRVLTLTAFGRALRATNIPKRVGNFVTYEGIRLVVDNAGGRDAPAPGPPHGGSTAFAALPEEG